MATRKRKKFEIHASDMAGFKQCQVRWNYSSPLRRHLEVAYPPVFFFLGSGIHSALATYYEHNINPVTAFKLWYWWRMRQYGLNGIVLSAERKQEYAEQAKLGVGMLKHYRRTYPSDKERFELVLAESRFNVPIRTLSGRKSGHYYASGIFDGVIVDSQGLYWLLEHKTYKSVRGEQQFELSDQAKMYVYAAQEQYGLPVQGILYNILRKNIPTVPRELARGGISKNKSIDTTYATYLQTIKDFGYEPSDYAEILGLLSDRGNTFFYRFPIRKSPKEMDVFKRLLYITAREMGKPGRDLIPSNDDWTCRMCWFREPCIMEQMGEHSAAEDWLSINTRKRIMRADTQFHYYVVRTDYQQWKAMTKEERALSQKAVAAPSAQFNIVVKEPATQETT